MVTQRFYFEHSDTFAKEVLEVLKHNMGERVEIQGFDHGGYLAGRFLLVIHSGRRPDIISLERPSFASVDHTKSSEDNAKLLAAQYLEHETRRRIHT